MKLLPVLLFVLAVGACAKPPDQAVPVIDEGKELFGAACARCHGPEGRGGVAQGTMPAPRNFHDAAFQSARTDAELKEVVRHGKGDKVVVFKMKRRKNYAKKQGHRQGFTEVKINDITLG